MERLEIHYLANVDGDLRFALLTDWMDAPTENLPGDDELLAAAASGIASLNKAHGPAPGGGARFFLFHRKRTWNEREQKWMGWERKRGKLHELNQLLRGSTQTNFIPVADFAPESIPGVRYVITLDADTRLSRGTAARLVGTMAHPLNRPQFSAELGRVVDGYGVVQPRVTPSLPTDREGSLFQRIFSGPSGIDPYSAAVSDVYQDLFHEGSYTGKGIYDLDAFEAALASKVKDNTLLSHDLFEGIFARAALATDIELFDEFPSHYEVAAARQHRWARGDWQLLPWIFGRGGLSKEERRKISIPAISRWKMLDNLRRTLSAPFMLLIMVGGLADAAGVALDVDALRPGHRRNSRADPISRRLECPAERHFQTQPLSRCSFRSVAGRIAIRINDYLHCLPGVADADAIVRTLVRLLFTRRNLLQWVTAAQAKHAVDLSLLATYGRMAASVLVAFAALLAVAVARPQALWAAIPFGALWIAAPAVARWISIPPPVADVEPLSASRYQGATLHCAAYLAILREICFRR